MASQAAQALRLSRPEPSVLQVTVTSPNTALGAPQGSGRQRSSLSRPEAGSPSAAAASPAQGRSQATASTSTPSAPADLGQVPLDAETIQHLHSTLRVLPRPLLESLTRAFRKRFQVPEEAVTIADRISQKCHHDWIEAFLVSHREVRSVEQHREVRSVEQHREVRSAEQHQRPGDR